MANTQINITENGTTTLATVGKYCDKNIDVIVNVSSGGGVGGNVATFQTTTESTKTSWSYVLPSDLDRTKSFYVSWNGAVNTSVVTSALWRVDNEEATLIGHMGYNMNSTTLALDDTSLIITFPAPARDRFSSSMTTGMCCAIIY